MAPGGHVADSSAQGCLNLLEVLQQSTVQAGLEKLSLTGLKALRHTFPYQIPALAHQW